MSIPQKTISELNIMRQAGQKLARIINELTNEIVEGNTGLLIEKKARALIEIAGAKPSFSLANPHYHYATCISVDEAIVHGLPSDEPFRQGQIIGLDVGLYYRGFHVDSAITVGIGNIDRQDQALIDVTRDSLKQSITKIKPGITLGVISHTIQKYVEDHHFSVIRQLTGHGIGRSLHEPPSIPNYGNPPDGPILSIGMTLAIEPMTSTGDWHVQIDRDGWTVRLAKGLKGAHFEHTVAVIENGAEILTQ